MPQSSCEFSLLSKLKLAKVERFNMNIKKSKKGAINEGSVACHTYCQDSDTLTCCRASDDGAVTSSSYDKGKPKSRVL